MSEKSPPIPRLNVPLNALRAFEAAGRHVSIKKAAGELGVTPSAVSHQVRQLEDSLGVDLLRRMCSTVGNTCGCLNVGVAFSSASER